MKTRRQFLAGAAATLGAAHLPAHAQPAPWPTRTVHLVSPYGAGGSNDISCRILAEALGKRLGQQFIVENKPGAGTRISNEYVARALPDGDTLLYAAAPYATVQALYGKLSYDPRKDLRAVSLAVVAPVFLIVNAASPYKTAADLMAAGKRRPEGLTFGSPGAGSGPHLAAELLFREAGIKGLNVHYRGDATAYTELLAGRLDATMTALTSALPHIQAGRLRVLAVGSEERSALYPSAPTLGEVGLPKVVGYGWFGFMAPSATPQPVVDRLALTVKDILAEPAIRERFAHLGLEARSSSPAQFSAFIDAEMKRWGEVIRTAGIQPG